MRHYGQDVDQHVLAQLAQSTGDGGTDGDALREALEKASGKLGVNVKSLYRMATTVRDWQDLAKDYNRLAKRKRLPEIPDQEWITQQGRMMNFSTGRLVDAFDWELYTAYRMDRLKSDYRRFQSNVKEYIDTGVPLTWSVILGRVEEQGLRQIGGAAHASDHRLQRQSKSANLFGFLGHRPRVQAHVNGRRLGHHHLRRPSRAAPGTLNQGRHRRLHSPTFCTPKVSEEAPAATCRRTVGRTAFGSAHSGQSAHREYRSR